MALGEIEGGINVYFNNMAKRKYLDIQTCYSKRGQGVIQTNEGKSLENMNSESSQEPLRSVTASNTVQTFRTVS